MPQNNATSPHSESKVSHEIIPIYTSDYLFNGQNTIQIVHGGQSYTLRITRENKLILTK